MVRLSEILCAMAWISLSLARPGNLETNVKIATPYQNNGNQLKDPNVPRSPSPAVAQWRREKPVDKVYVTPCIKKCMNKTYQPSGCSSVYDWPCLCRNPTAPRWPEEMFTCFRDECRSERDSENAKAVLYVNCRRS
ncbi:hypothetical protein QBC39DRAFT_346041 [Podospora conica]|nr:hypothetical protein QBC39DRAFT_346041 [Schizothecium conicum]